MANLSRGETRANRSRRLLREEKTLKAMLLLYCRAHHRMTSGLCPDCRELEQYALRRLARCPFQEDKPTCANCTVHCYRAGMQEKIRAVMRYSGPRMMLRHPFLALWHLLDSRRVPDPVQDRRQNPPDGDLSR